MSLKLLENSSLACTLSQCKGPNHQPLAPELAQAWLKDWDSATDDLTVMRALRVLVQHSNPAMIASTMWSKVLWRAWRAMKSPDRRTRRAGG